MRKDHIKDFYFYKAKREKYSARSIYKLKNIQERYKLFSKGNKVMDLGAAPGSWSEYLCELLGKKGLLISLDEKPLSMTAQQKVRESGVEFQFLEQSVFSDIPLDIPPLDVVVSDMAPQTSGSRITDQMASFSLAERAFEIARGSLKVGGHFVAKLFQAEETAALAKSWEDEFKFSKLYRPPSTHKESKEIFFVGMHLRK